MPPCIILELSKTVHVTLSGSFLAEFSCFCIGSRLISYREIQREKRPGEAIDIGLLLDVSASIYVSVAL